MIRIRISTLTAILVLLSWTVAVAQHNHGGGHQQHQGMGNTRQHTPNLKTGSFKSRILEMKEGEMVVEGKYQGKVQRMTVRTDSNTKMEGRLETGSEVKISYREDMPGSLYATAVKGPKPKS